MSTHARHPVPVLGTILALALLLTLLPTPATAHDDTPPHGHVLLLHVDAEVNPNYDPDDPETGPRVFIYDYGRCVDLANGRALPNRAHHAGIHTGQAGEALFVRGGHLVVPLAPITPFTGCAQLDAIFKAS